MKQIKLLCTLLFLIVFSNSASSLDLDSLKSTAIKYEIGRFNSDCYKDTIYGEVYSKYKILPKFIIWGVEDSTTVCDSTYNYYYDSLNTSVTFLEFDSTSAFNTNLLTLDFNKDNISDLLVIVRLQDSVTQDSTLKYIIYGNNNISKNLLINFSVDSLLNDSLFVIEPSSSNNIEKINTTNTNSIYLVKYIDVIPMQINDNIITSAIMEEENFKIYPNPNLGTLNIISSYTPYNLSIFSNIGEKMFNQNLIYNKESKFNISSFPSGVYFLEVNYNDTKKVFKIIKSN